MVHKSSWMQIRPPGELAGVVADTTLQMPAEALPKTATENPKPTPSGESSLPSTSLPPVFHDRKRKLPDSYVRMRLAAGAFFFPPTFATTATAPAALAPLGLCLLLLLLLTSCSTADPSSPLLLLLLALLAVAAARFCAFSSAAL